MTTKKTFKPPAASRSAVLLDPPGRPPKEHERRYYSRRPCDDEAYDTASFRQNLEATDGDHWLLELNLERWRSAADMAAYLRWAADQMELLASRSNAEVSDGV